MSLSVLYIIGGACRPEKRNAEVGGIDPGTRDEFAGKGDLHFSVWGSSQPYNGMTESAGTRSHARKKWLLADSESDGFGCYCYLPSG